MVEDDGQSLEKCAMNLDLLEAGQRAFRLAEELFPLCRSLTGGGVRQTLKILQRSLPLKIHEVPSGAAAYDWNVPHEWNVRDAYVKDLRGRRVIDFRTSNLHLVGYSIPFRGIVTKEELLGHLYSDPVRPDWIPYRHTYSKESWGFCVTHHLLQTLSDEQYEVCIDTSLEPGSLTYGEIVVPGRSAEEILVSTHTCHPSLSNDNLSGIVVATVLASCLMKEERALTYRLLFAPATLGPLVWLSQNESIVPRIQHGLVLACVGDAGPVTYVRSRRGNALVDRAVAHVLKHGGDTFTIKDFAPEGYDQRQFCSPGFDLPVGCFMRTPNGCYPEYHTSADNMELIKPEALGDSIGKIFSVFHVLEGNKTYVNQCPKGEPQLGKRELYHDARSLGLWWTLNFSDGRHSLLDIAERSNISFDKIEEGARALVSCGLLQDVSVHAS
jgi:aminopeptidase-like protein